MARSRRHPLHAFFARFIRSRAIHRHDHRRSMLETLGGTAHERAVPAHQAQDLRQAAAQAPQALFEHLNSSPQGMSASQADTIRSHTGGNDIDQEQPLAWWQLLWQCYRTPFDLLLSLLGVVNFLTGDLRGTLVIGSMVCLSVDPGRLPHLAGQRPVRGTSGDDS